MFGTVLFFYLVCFIIFWNLAWATLITPNVRNSLTLSRTTHSRLLLADPQKRGVLVCVSVCREADWPRHLSSPCPVISLCNSDKCQAMSRGWALTNCSRRPRFTSHRCCACWHLLSFRTVRTFESAKNSFLWHSEGDILYSPGTQTHLLNPVQMTVCQSELRH